MRTWILAVLAIAVLAVSGCGEPAAVAGDEPAGDAPAAGGGGVSAPATGSPAAGMCAVGATECVDVVVGTEGELPPFDVDSEVARARGLLGLAEDELPPDVRVGRRGDEHLALTEDYVLGRSTVELEADAGGVFRVVAVTVELFDGPERYEH